MHLSVERRQGFLGPRSTMRRLSNQGKQHIVGRFTAWRFDQLPCRKRSKAVARPRFKIHITAAVFTADRMDAPEARRESEAGGGGSASRAIERMSDVGDRRRPRRRVCSPSCGIAAPTTWIHGSNWCPAARRRSTCAASPAALLPILLRSEQRSRSHGATVGELEDSSESEGFSHISSRETKLTTPVTPSFLCEICPKRARSPMPPCAGFTIMGPDRMRRLSLAPFPSLG